MTLDYAKHCRVHCGSYIEAHDDPDITNTLKNRTSPCIALGPTGNFQGLIWAYNLETKAVTKRQEFTPLPMPNRVVKHVLALGKWNKQTKTAQRIKFLNRSKQRFDWDDDLDAYQELVQTEPREADQLIAEIPGVRVESDYEDQALEPAPEPMQADLATQALANANLSTPQEDGDIAGVDIADNARNKGPPKLIHPDSSDDEDGDDDDGGGGGDVVYIGENLAPPAPQEDAIVVDDDEEEAAFDGNADEGNGEQAGDDTQAAVNSDDDAADDASEHSTGAVRLRRSRRRKRRRQPTVIDHDNREADYSNRAYVVEDGTLHINPNVLEQAQEDTKITSKLIPPAKETPVKIERVKGGVMSTSHPKYVYEGSRVGINMPWMAGILGAALAAVTMPPPKLSEGEHLVEDHVVLHIVGVVLAQQYSINKGIKLFGDRAKESVSKELQQLHDYETYIPVHAHELTKEQRESRLLHL
jgi:hypothetical protein